MRNSIPERQKRGRPLWVNTSRSVS